jgi:hypothetical protein
VWALLALVALAAAVLSFSALRDLALVCGFSGGLAWLLPVTIDAGAAAGALAWLGGPVAGRLFGRTLTWALLSTSVVGNAVSHYLSAYHLAPAWWLVVLVSAVAPAVLGCGVHLAVLVGRTVETASTPAECPSPEITEPARGDHYPPPTPAVPAPEPVAPPVPELAAVPDPDPVVSLIESGAGRGRIAKELGITEHQARKLLEGKAA